MKAAAPLVRWMMRRSLRRAFRRVAWIGPAPALPEGVPVILYANHHNFYDGYLGWLVAARLLGRPAMTWMEAWDRFPFFGAVGALPFPPGDPRRRAATVRRTLRRFEEASSSVLVYFPEGRLHPPDEGLDPFPEGAFARLAR
ncbi:MAG: acyltransferase, partial [Rhodothermales bacterium]|nr:acyltransferase [Rhodothermales bacterium]